MELPKILFIVKLCTSFEGTDTDLVRTSRPLVETSNRGNERQSPWTQTRERRVRKRTIRELRVFE